METLGTYKLVSSFTNKNAGYSTWGFGKKNGKVYFIKQFIEQKYPSNDNISSAARLQKKIKECEDFEQRKKALYQALNENSDGNAIRVEEFFRVESKYYISMQKIESVPLSISTIAALPIDEIKRLCYIIAHAVSSIHNGHLIHADLKHDNIMFMKTNTGLITAKITDFDSGFLETNPPAAGEDIIGDLVYFSPEACISIWGQEIQLTCKMDVFALGVLFHQYFTDELPKFNTEENTYPGEAVAKGEKLIVSDKLPDDIRDLLIRMLDPDPSNRPSAFEVYQELSGIDHSEEIVIYEEDNEDSKSVTKMSSKTTQSDPFFRPGDL